MKEAYVTILPSFSDDSPNLILEGLSFGKPFIATKFNGLQDQIGSFGISVDPRDQSALTEAIIRMADIETYDLYRKRIAVFSYTHTYDDIARDLIQLFNTLK